jgi:hypothetical protein
MTVPPRVFISHTTQDQRDLILAQSLAKGLRAGGADVWIAPDRIPSGSQWELEIAEALNNCSHFIVILSAASITADWVQKEIELARKRYEIDETLHVLPLPVGKIGSYSNKDFLAQFQTLRYFDNLDDQLHEIGKALHLPCVLWVEYLKNVIRELGSISLVPGQDSVPIEKITPVRVVGLGKTREESYELTDLPQLASKIVLVGPGGCGKTIALQWLAHRFAIECLESNVRQDTGSKRFELIPVLVNLGTYTNSLFGLIQQALSIRGAAADDETIRLRFREGNILLLLDGFDEVTNKRKLVSDLQELLVLSPNSPIILTSRLISPLNSSLFTRFERFDLEALDNVQVKNVFSLLLEQAKAESLLHVIQDQKLIDAFRQPLMACLVATSNQQGNEQYLPISKGALYNKILNYFVRQWEARRQEQLVTTDALVKVACLSRLGYTMTVCNQTFLSEEQFEDICRQEIRRTNIEPSVQVVLTEGLLSTGLLKRSTEGVSFSHLSFKDFFTANWLKVHFGLRALLRLSWQSQWHEAFVHLAGLLSNSQAEKLLRWMVIFSRLSILVARFGPYTWSANQLLLTLNCLGNTNESHNSLKDQLTRHMIGSDVYLSKATITPDQTLPRGLDSIYAYFCVLVGRLRTSGALRFLKQYKSRQTRVCGLAQFGDMQILLQEFEDPDVRDGGVADTVAADFILRFPADVVVNVIEDFLNRDENGPSKRLLSSLNSCFGGYDEEIPYNDQIADRYSLLSENVRWFPLMTDLALRNEDEKIRDSAFSIIRCFGANKSSLPKPAEEIIALAVREDPEEDVKIRALWYLVYGDGDYTLGLLREFVSEATERLTLAALDALRLRDRKQFPLYMSSVIKRLYGGILTGEGEMLLERLLESINLSSSCYSANVNVREMFKCLIAGALLHRAYFVRRFSIEALFITAVKQVAPVLAAALSVDEHEAVREKALLGLKALLKGEAEPYIYKGFEDESPLVRTMAVDSFYSLPEDLGVKAISKLQALSCTDPDDGVRRAARGAAKRFIKGDW